MISAHLLKSIPRVLFEFDDSSPDFMVRIWSALITKGLGPRLDKVLVWDANRERTRGELDLGSDSCLSSRDYDCNGYPEVGVNTILNLIGSWVFTGRFNFGP